MVLSFGVVLQMEHANFFVVAALISNCYISFCNADESYMRGKMIELLAIRKCQLVLHTDIDISSSSFSPIFLGQNQSFSGSCGSLLAVLL